jgi:hypothetical protein
VSFVRGALRVAVLGVVMLAGCMCGGGVDHVDGGSDHADGGDAGATVDGGDAGPAVDGGSWAGLHVLGNQIVDSNGVAIHLRGVTHLGTEYTCMKPGLGFADDEQSITDASISAMVGWGINAVRIPLNEGCWLNSGVPDGGVGGAAYQAAVESYVSRLTDAGVVTVLTLSWVISGSGTANQPSLMPDRSNSPMFWSQVATAFASNRAVAFDLFDEPSVTDWTCWSSGGTCTGVSYTVAGMQELVSSVRATGATNLILISGAGAANDLTGWLANAPSDPQKNLAASWHVFDFSACKAPACFDTQVGPLAMQIPVVATAIGSNQNVWAFSQAVIDWLHSKDQGFMAFTWNTWSGSPMTLVSDNDGAPTPYGSGLKQYLATH